MQCPSNNCQQIAGAIERTSKTPMTTTTIGTDRSSSAALLRSSSEKTTNFRPYNPATNIIDPGLARQIRQWALTDGRMSEAELHALSQRQALRAYIDGHIVPTLDKVLGRQRSPEESQE